MTKQDRIDALVESGLHQVDRIARNVARKMGGGRGHARQIELDDLRSAGHVGLIQAAHAFDAKRGCQFSAFAEKRIYGAIVDDVRASSALSRKHWQEVKDGQSEFFENTLTDAVMARTAAPSGEHSIQTSLMVDRVSRAIDGLPQARMRRIMRGLLRDELHTDLAKVVGVNASRVSQLQQQAVRLIRKELNVVLPFTPGFPAETVASPRQQKVWNEDQIRERRARAVKNGKRGAAVTRMLRRPKGGFGAQRTA